MGDSIIYHRALWILWRGRVSSGVAFATMLTGFGTCVIAYTGNKVFGWWEAYGFEHRFLPYAAATLVPSRSGIGLRTPPGP